jgi:catechol-2,3-dioxygenase
VERFGYVALGVPDLDRAVAFYETFAHLTVTERTESSAFLSGGSAHHWVRLDRSDTPGLIRVAYQVCDAAALAEAMRRLEERGIAFKELDDVAGDRVSGAIRFEDPDGIEIELFTDMVSLARPASSPVINIVDAIHAGWRVESPVRTAPFYEQVLGFLPSDWIESRAVFLRAANGYHHSVTLGTRRGPAPEHKTLDHLCILVDDIDSVMRARSVAKAYGIETRGEAARHAASGSVSVYIVEPITGTTIEFAVWHRKILEPNYRHRVLAGGPTTANMWEFEPSRHSSWPLPAGSAATES